MHAIMMETGKAALQHDVHEAHLYNPVKAKSYAAETCFRSAERRAVTALIVSENFPQLLYIPFPKATGASQTASPST